MTLAWTQDTVGPICRSSGLRARVRCDFIRSLGVTVVPFTLPDVPIEAIDFIRYAETAAAFDDVTRAGVLTEVALTNRTGHPVISVPNGFSHGSPTALHLTGKLFGEQEILLLAHAFQARTDFHLQDPRL